MAIRSATTTGSDSSSPAENTVLPKFARVRQPGAPRMFADTGTDWNVVSSALIICRWPSITRNTSIAIVFM